MQYNKYALALVLLASSAFAAGASDASGAPAASAVDPPGTPAVTPDASAGRSNSRSSRSTIRSSRSDAPTALVEKIKAAIPDGKSFDQIETAKIGKLGLSQEQIDALTKAKATKASEIADILNSVDSNPDGNNPVGTGGSSSSVAIPFYQNKLFIGVVVVLVVASIGGGAYMMTHKSEETDL